MNPPMNHAGYDHHKMMIADFKKWFYVVHSKKMKKIK